MVSSYLAGFQLTLLPDRLTWTMSKIADLALRREPTSESRALSNFDERRDRERRSPLRQRDVVQQLRRCRGSVAPRLRFRTNRLRDHQAHEPRRRWARRNATDAYQKALATDPVSAFGGIVAFNRAVDAAAAQEATKIFTEVVIAPDYDRRSARNPEDEKEPSCYSDDQTSEVRRSSSSNRSAAACSCKRSTIINSIRQQLNVVTATTTD